MCTQKNRLSILSTHNKGLDGQIRILENAKRPLSISCIFLTKYLSKDNATMFTWTTKSIQRLKQKRTVTSEMTELVCSSNEV